MLKLNQTGQFRKDFKRCQKRGFDMSLLVAVVDTLVIPEELPEKNRDHVLGGEYTGFRECHIQPDWLLVYRVKGEDLFLARTGTHSDLFR